MTKKRIIFVVSCISIVLLSFSIFNTIKIKKQKQYYKSKIESLDKEYIEKIDLLVKELGERIDKPFNLNQLYYRDSFNETINYVEESIDKYIYLINQISILNKEYKKLYNNNKVPDEYVYEHVQMTEVLDGIENANSYIAKGERPFSLKSEKESGNILNSLKESMFNNSCTLLQFSFLGVKDSMTGNLVENREIELKEGVKGFLEYRNDLMDKLNISDYYIAKHLINAKYYKVKNIESTVPEYYKSQNTFIDNDDSKDSNNAYSNVMMSISVRVENLNHAVYEKEYNDVVEQYTDISNIAKKSLNEINNYIEYVNDDKLKEIINMYIIAFDKHYKAYNTALNSLDTISSPEEGYIITEMIDEATLSLENANIAYDKYKQN